MRKLEDFFQKNIAHLDEEKITKMGLAHFSNKISVTHFSGATD
jgi:hypothetical protein